MKKTQSRFNGQILDGITTFFKDETSMIRHRIGGPAVIHKDYEIYIVDDQYHRIGGPAYHNFKDDYKVYWQNGKLHNENGPAVEGLGFCEYWLFGEKYTKMAWKLKKFRIGL